MPTYHYRCKAEDCEIEFELVQSIKDEELTKCPECNEDSLTKVFYAVPVLVKSEPQTLATLAGRNSDRIGRAAVEDKTEQRRLEVEAGMKRANEELEAKLPPGATLMKGKKENPFWRPKTDKPMTELSKLNVKQQVKYIETGVK